MILSRVISASPVAWLLATTAQAETANRPRLLPMTALNSTSAPAGTGDMFYYGGSVFSGVKLVSVIWNKDVLQNTKDQIPLFSAAIVDSTYVDQMQEYDTKGVDSINGHGSTDQKINR